MCIDMCIELENSSNKVGTVGTCILDDFNPALQLMPFWSRPEMYRRKTLYIEQGPEWPAVIAGQGYELTKTIRAHSREQAEKLVAKAKLLAVISKIPSDEVRKSAAEFVG